MNGKIALGALGGIGLITTVSLASSRSGPSDPSWAKGIPSFSFLSANKAFMEKSYREDSSQFGYRYAGLLVEGADTNNGWWKWSYKNLKEDLRHNDASLEETFKAVSASHQTPNSADSLKAWCSEIYKVDMNSHRPFDAPDSIFNNTSIWKYCSPIQKLPVSLEKSGANYSERTVGKVMGWALLALDGNDRIWHYRNKFFTGIKVEEFHEDTSYIAFREGRKNGKNVKDICTDIYRQTTGESGIHADIVFFCSISQMI